MKTFITSITPQFERLESFGKPVDIVCSQIDVSLHIHFGDTTVTAESCLTRDEEKEFRALCQKIIERVKFEFAEKLKPAV